jgi:hypothetical protein
MASQDRGPGGAERADGVAAQEGGAAGAAMLGAAAGAAAPNPATESWGDDRAPESASDLASRGGVPGGAERADGVAAQEGGAVGAATLGAAAGAVAPDPTAEPRGDDPARRSAKGRAGGAERVEGVAAQVNERVDGVAAQEGGAAWKQGVKTEVRGLLPPFLACEGSKTGESMPKFCDASSGTRVAAPVDERADRVAAQGSVITPLLLLLLLPVPLLLLLLAGDASEAGEFGLALPEFPLGVTGTDLVGGSERVEGVNAFGGRCVEGAARWARGGAWRTLRGGRDRRGRGGEAALAHHA